MNKNDWRELEKIYDELILLPEIEQHRFIQEKTQQFPHLASQIENLLNPVDNFLLKDIIAENAAELVRTEVPEWVAEIEKYRVKSLIAKGGMGDVYLGVRVDNEFEQQVAVKILSTHLNNEASKLRFLRERQILADFHHPNIARLLDGGTSKEGTPYLIMEYIQGEAIDQYCDRHALSIDDRIKLVIKICNAISYAHQQLIVHRDIKPSNILVNAQGEPFLLDFGIAKTLSESKQYSKEITITQNRMLTPEIASPEQIMGQPTTPATDVYGLGILLYRLLSGCYPFTLSNKEPSTISSYQQLERRICTSPPPRPSKILLSLKNEKTAEFCLPIEAHAKSLKGDLENIILKALRKQAAHRYASSQALADDLKRYLNHEPVLAKPQSIGYVTKKLIQRHPFGSITSVVVIFTLIITVFFYTIQLRQQRDIAQKQLATAKTVTQFLVDSFQIADPGESMGDKITAKQILDQGAARISGEFDIIPEVKAEMLYVIGQVYLSIGELVRARTLLEEADEIAGNILGEKSEKKLQIQTALGRLSAYQGNQQESKKRLSKALQIALKEYPESHLLPGEIANALIPTLQGLEEFEQLENLLAEMITRYSKILPEWHPIMLKLRTGAYNLNLVRGSLSEALTQASFVFEISRKHYGEKHPLTIQTQFRLAKILYKDGQLKKAKSIAETAYQNNRQIFGEKHYSNISILSSLAGINGELFDSQASIKNNVELIQIATAYMGEKSGMVGDGYNSIGLAYQDIGNFDKAIEAVKKSIEINTANLGETSLEVAINHTNLGAIYMDSQQFELAEKHLLKGLEIKENVIGKDTDTTAYSYNHIGTMYTRIKEWKKAKIYLAKSLSVREKINTAHSPHLLAQKAKLVRVMIKLKEFKNAQMLMDETIQSAGNIDNQHIVPMYFIRLVESILIANLSNCELALAKYNKIIHDAENNIKNIPSFLHRINDVNEICLKTK
ncbi:protein kinase domain-containing protein [Aliikangiella sp. IMCC44359]|uniref:protein kinase domain-containing protein n=1 Tax=Aliikangiella sp. IMCC44359 TaxID=3459125 RepID=UPI00403B213B